MKEIFVGNDELCAACPADDESVELCKKYIEDHNLSTDDVKIVKTKSCIMVKVRDGREVSFERGEYPAARKARSS